MYNARMFGCETEVGQSRPANPDWACCLAFLDQVKVLAIPKSILQVKLCKTFRGSSLPIAVKFWNNFSTSVAACAKVLVKVVRSAVPPSVSAIGLPKP